MSITHFGKKVGRGPKKVTPQSKNTAESLHVFDTKHLRITKPDNLFGKLVPQSLRYKLKQSTSRKHSYPEIAVGS